MVPKCCPMSSLYTKTEWSLSYFNNNPLWSTRGYPQPLEMSSQVNRHSNFFWSFFQSTFKQNFLYRPPLMYWWINYNIHLLCVVLTSRTIWECSISTVKALCVFICCSCINICWCFISTWSFCELVWTLHLCKTWRG